MENKLELNLFKRSGKQIFLTAEGEKLWNTTEEIFQNLENALKEIAEEKDECIGRIRIGSLSGVGKSFINHQLIDFCKTHPAIDCEIQLEDVPELIAKFQSCELDACVLPEKHLPETGEKYLLGTEEISLVFPKSKLVKKKFQNSITLENLLEFPIIDFGPKHSLFDTWCAQYFPSTKNSSPHVVKRIQVNSHGSILYAVSLGLGIAVVPNHVLKRSFYKDQVEHFHYKYAVKNQRFFLVLQSTAINLKRHKLLVEYLLQQTQLCRGVW